MRENTEQKIQCVQFPHNDCFQNSETTSDSEKLNLEYLALFAFTFDFVHSMPILILVT